MPHHNHIHHRLNHKKNMTANNNVLRRLESKHANLLHNGLQRRNGFITIDVYKIVFVLTQGTKYNHRKSFL